MVLKLVCSLRIRDLIRLLMLSLHRSGSFPIIANPVFPQPVNPGPWWHSRRAIKIVTGEHNKYLFALTGTGSGSGPRAR